MTRVSVDCVPIDPSRLLSRQELSGASGVGSNDDSSVDTQDAFFEMLGLPRGTGLPSLDLSGDQQESETVPSSSPSPSRSTLASSTIPIPRRCSRYLHPPNKCVAFSIDNFFSKEECEKLVQLAETKDRGFAYVTEAAHTAADGTTYSVQLQQPNPHKLSVFQHPPTVARMWHELLERANIVPLIESFMDREKCGPPLGLNPRLRVLRYDSLDNDRFEPHFDATTMVGSHQKSLLTVLLYLNNGDGIDFDGGETLYLDSHISTQIHQTEDGETKVTPKAGKIVIFEHDLFHSGAPLQWGTKYVLRTDILFRSKDDDERGRVQDTDYALNYTTDEHGAVTLVSNLCDELQLSDEDRAMLDSMGMLDITLDCFISPGIVTLKNILKDIMNVETVDKLVHGAANHVNS